MAPLVFLSRPRPPPPHPIPPPTPVDQHYAGFLDALQGVQSMPVANQVASLIILFLHVVSSFQAGMMFQVQLPHFLYASNVALALKYKIQTIGLPQQPYEMPFWVAVRTCLDCVDPVQLLAFLDLVAFLSLNAVFRQSIINSNIVSKLIELLGALGPQQLVLVCIALTNIAAINEGRAAVLAQVNIYGSLTPLFDLVTPTLVVVEACKLLRNLIRTREASLLIPADLLARVAALIFQDPAGGRAPARAEAITRSCHPRVTTAFALPRSDCWSVPARAIAAADAR